MKTTWDVEIDEYLGIEVWRSEIMGVDVVLQENEGYDLVRWHAAGETGTADDVHKAVYAATQAIKSLGDV